MSTEPSLYGGSENENGVATDMAYIEPKQMEEYRAERPTGGKSK